MVAYVFIGLVITLILFNIIHVRLDVSVPPIFFAIRIQAIGMVLLLLFNLWTAILLVKLGKILKEIKEIKEKLGIKEIDEIN